MKARTQLRVCTYVLALFGFWSVTLTEHFTSAWPVALTAMVAAAWFFEGPRKHADAYRRVWAGLIIGMLAFFPFDVILSGKLLLPAVHILIFTQTYLLFNPKNITAYRRIFIVSFGQLLASTNLTTDMVFAVILTAYCVVAFFGIMLMQLLGELRTSDGAGVARLAEQRVPRSLLISSLVWTTLLAPLTLGFFFSAPRLQYAVVAGGSNVQTLDQMKRARARTGFTKSVQLGTFGRIQEDQTLALRVELPEDYRGSLKTLRWRGGALNIYDGMAWSSSRDHFAYYSGKRWLMGNRNFGMIYPKGDNLFITDGQYAHHNSTEQLDADPTLLKQVCYLEVPFSDSIFGAGEIKAIQGPFKYGVGQNFNRSFSIHNRQALAEFITYTVYSRVHEPAETQLRRISHEQFEELLSDESHGQYVRIHYLQVPPGLNPRIRDLAMDITRNATTPYDKVDAIKSFLETQFTYSLDLDKPITDDPLSDFLFVSRTGHCEYFATAMTLMTRIAGIPARVGKGFQRGEWNDTGRFYEVRQRDAHAWVEVYFPNHGWIAFDPSPREVADEYFERQRSRVARAFSTRLLLLQIQWRKHVVGYNETRRLRLFAEIRNLLLRDGPKATVGMLGAVTRRAWNLLASHSTMAILFTLFLVTVFAAYRKNILVPSLSWPVLLLMRGRNGALFYERMLRLLERKKIVKPAYVTPLEFLDYPALRQHPMFSDIEILTAMYYRVRFGGKALPDDETTSINNILGRLKQCDA